MGVLNEKRCKRLFGRKKENDDVLCFITQYGFLILQELSHLRHEHDYVHH